MIELIFSLVVMGIVLLSAPMLVSTATSSTYVALQQEGINEASSRVIMIMSYPWDENDTSDIYVPPILHVSAGHPDLEMVKTRARRLGTPMASTRTFILSDLNSSELNASVALGFDADDASTQDDMDDFIDNNSSLTLVGAIGTNDIDYAETTTVEIRTNIAYADDNTTKTGGDYNASTITYAPFSTLTAGSTSNIKTITVTLTSSENSLDKTIILKAFSCNIGGYDFKTRY
jgi:hypothetical protein